MLCLWAPIEHPAFADDAFPLVRNNFGSVGMIDMPSARFAPDGQLSLGAAYFENTQRYNFGFQMLPWLEGDFRYSGLDHFDPSFPVYWDRSFAVKARLWQESEFIPAIAVGVNDLVGTGVYSSEYLVASKRFDTFDFSLGMGWGRLASTALIKNPFAEIFPAFQSRPTFTNPGGANFNVFFHGPNSSLFGGVVWQTPVKNLSLIAEYSSDSYATESASGNFKPRNQFNFGAAYQLTEGVNVGIDWLYGRSIGGNISFQLDPTSAPYPQTFGSPPQPPDVRTPKEQQVALRRLLDQRNGLSTQPSHFAANNALVDALWRNENNLSGVTIQGHTFSIKISHGDASTTCHDVAQTFGLYAMSIDTIDVSNNNKHVSCMAARPAFVSTIPELHNEVEMASSLSLIPASFITIDASVDAPTDAHTAITRLQTDARKQSLIIQAVDLHGAESVIYFSNTHYYSEVDALDRLIRLVMADAPTDIEKIRLIEVLNGIPQREFDVLRTPIERSFEQTGKLNFADDVTPTTAPMQNPVLTTAENGTYPHFTWSVFPQFRQQLFDPSNPFGVQFLAGASGTAEILPGLSLTGEAEASIWDNFNVNRVTDSELPRVRTDFLKYFTKGKNGIGNLEADYRFRFAPNVFGILKIGYLESMFAGVGGEVLWRPEGQRWALSGDLYEVQQRDFDRLFGLQSYRATTGHVSLYYDSPWYDINFEVRAGQYLAGDRGLTFEMSRRFSTGVEVGAFFTKTNVSAAQFGEGSFDKGIVLRIPLGWVAPIDTQNEFDTTIRPVQRDGGQPLDGDAPLYYETERTSDGELLRQRR